MGGDSSYTELLTCLEMARDVRQLHSEGQTLAPGSIPRAPPGRAAQALTVQSLDCAKP